jgi:hypothetical protein
MNIISHIISNKGTSPIREYESFRDQFRDLYIQLLNHKIFQKNYKLSTEFMLQFSSNEGVISSFEIKKPIYFKEKRLTFTNNTLLKYPPNKEIKGFLLKIHTRLLELWNTVSSFEELEFLLFHINNMPPLGEVYFEPRSNMLKKIPYLNQVYPQSIRGIDKIATNEKFKRLKLDSNNNEKYHELEHLVASNLNENDSLLKNYSNNDNKELIDKVIAFLIEILGYATQSNNEQNPEDFGIIGLNIELLKNFYTKIERHSSFNDLKERLFKCYGYKITKRDFVFESILEKVFYHEFGHLYFGHCRLGSHNNVLKNPNKKRESYANFFASLISNNQLKSSLIWLQTRFQSKEYQFPILLKFPESYNDTRNTTCNFNVDDFTKHCENEIIGFGNEGIS